MVNNGGWFSELCHQLAQNLWKNLHPLPETYECLNGSAGHFYLLDFRGSSLLPVSAYQLRGLIALNFTRLAVEGWGKEDVQYLSFYLNLYVCEEMMFSGMVISMLIPWNLKLGHMRKCIWIKVSELVGKQNYVWQSFKIPHKMSFWLVRNVSAESLQGRVWFQTCLKGETCSGSISRSQNEWLALEFLKLLLSITTDVCYAMMFPSILLP